MQRITTTELWNLIRNEGSQFFSVEFERRTKSNTAQQGEIRKMLCRTGMKKYKKGIISDADRDARDYKHGIITVWSVDAYNKNRSKGMSKDDAAFNAWRNIDLVTVRKCSLLKHFNFPDDLPPDIIIGHHQITNVYRLENLPRTPIGV